MADFKYQTGSLTGRINLNEASEVDYWCYRFHCSKKELIEAVRRVGYSVSRVEEFLISQKMEHTRI
jgi:hypothetical protein